MRIRLGGTASGAVVTPARAAARGGICHHGIARERHGIARVASPPRPPTARNGRVARSPRAAERTHLWRCGASLPPPPPVPVKPKIVDWLRCGAAALGGSAPSAVCARCVRPLRRFEARESAAVPRLGGDGAQCPFFSHSGGCPLSNRTSAAAEPQRACRRRSNNHTRPARATRRFACAWCGACVGPAAMWFSLNWSGRRECLSASAWNHASV